MAQKRPRLPGSDETSARPLADRVADARLRLRVMRPSFVSMMMRPTAPPIWLGIVVAGSLLLVETVAVVYLKQLTGQPFGTLYMVDVLVVSTVWGFGLSAFTSVVTALAYTYFRNWPHTHFGPWELGFWMSIVVFLSVALLANIIAAVARTGERFSELSSDLLAIVGPDRFIRVNRACKRILGYSESEMTAQPWINLVAPEDRDLVRSTLGALDGSTHPARFECRMIYKDGSLRWIEWNVVWHGGLAYAIGRDITERRHEQDQLYKTRTMLEASRDGLSVLAKQQEALRRMATIVANGLVTPSEVYSAVAEEMVRCLDCDGAAVVRYEPDASAVLIAASAKPGSAYPPVGERMPFDEDNLLTWILQTGRAARHDDIGRAGGPVLVRIREFGIRSGVGAPIVVNGRVWGAAIVSSKQQEPLPPDTEERVSDFADLVATAIANAASRAELIASRARIVAAADDARRRIERNLHDGAQQQLIALALDARMAEASVPAELDGLKQQLAHLASGLKEANEDLQEISRGLHPSILTKGGLLEALKALARRSAIPVTFDVVVDRRLPESAEVAAYYVVAEGLANAVKHSRASEVTVSLTTKDMNLRIRVQDNGIGGAHVGKGSGLIGLFDRVEALGGQFTIDCPPEGGTALQAAIPLGLE
ncbi:MAG TPA: GAF domain-containing protein [Mycobacterium sp.]|nr:GAF domain-containing protein [Mycobacterium sp.]